MYQMLLNLWTSNRLTEAQLNSAISRGWVTPEQRDEIAAMPRAATA